CGFVRRIGGGHPESEPTSLETQQKCGPQRVDSNIKALCRRLGLQAILDPIPGQREIEHRKEGQKGKYRVAGIPTELNGPLRQSGKGERSTGEPQDSLPGPAVLATGSAQYRDVMTYPSHFAPRPSWAGTGRAPRL